MEKLLLRPIEAAEALGVGRSTIYELVAEGTVPSVRLGRLLRVPAASLRDLVEDGLNTNRKVGVVNQHSATQ